MHRVSEKVSDKINKMEMWNEGGRISAFEIRGERDVRENENVKILKIEIIYLIL